MGGSFAAADSLGIVSVAILSEAGAAPSPGMSWAGQQSCSQPNKLWVCFLTQKPK